MLPLPSRRYGSFEALASPRAWVLFSEHQSCLRGKSGISPVPFFCGLLINRIDDQNISASLSELSWALLCYSAAPSWVCNIEGKLAGPSELQDTPCTVYREGVLLLLLWSRPCISLSSPCERCQPQQWALTVPGLLLVASAKYPIHLDRPAGPEARSILAPPVPSFNSLKEPFLPFSALCFRLNSPLCSWCEMVQTLSISAAFIQMFTEISLADTSRCHLLSSQ